jgi:hypothetical protein
VPRLNLDDVVRDALAKSVKKVALALERRLALVAESERARARAAAGSRRGRAPAARRSRPRGKEITRWVADRRARRVPTFVIEMTGGLDTKKKIVSKFGANAAFEKGKALPKPAKAA